jgi:hypothetical protein
LHAGVPQAAKPSAVIAERVRVIPYTERRSTMTRDIADAGGRDIEQVGERDFKFGATGVLLMIAAALLLAILA